MNPPPPATPTGDSAREGRAILLSRLLGSDQWERAHAVAREWLAEEPDALVAHRAAAQSLLNLGRHRLASPHLQRALAANPDDGFGWRLAAIADFGQGRYDRADAAMQRAIRLQPNDPWHWYQLALMRYRHSQRRAALKYARKALELAPAEADILNLVALCEGGSPQQRLTRYQSALELAPENAVVHNNVGAHYLYTERDYLRAIEAFRQALALNPTDRVARENLLVALRESDPLHRAFRWAHVLPATPAREQTRWNVRRVVTVAMMIPGLNVVLALGGLLLMIYGAPLVVAYERLLRHHVHEQAGLLGARRGGWLDFWRWGHWTRVAVVFTMYTAVWVVTAVYVWRMLPSASQLPPFF